MAYEPALKAPTTHLHDFITPFREPLPRRLDRDGRANADAVMLRAILLEHFHSRETHRVTA